MNTVLSIRDYAHLETLARKYRTIQASISALEEDAGVIKATLISELDTLQADEVRAGEYTIRHSLYDSRRVDTAALRSAGLYDQFSKVTTSTRFTVS